MHCSCFNKALHVVSHSDVFRPDQHHQKRFGSLALVSLTLLCLMTPDGYSVSRATSTVPQGKTC